MTGVHRSEAWLQAQLRRPGKKIGAGVLKVMEGDLKRSKYGNVKTVVDGITFDSGKEALRYAQLRLLEAAGLVQGLHVHKRFRLEINGQLICQYEADFVYEEAPAPRDWINAQVIVEDCKGVRTPVYKLKKRLMKAIHGIEIREI